MAGGQEAGAPSRNAGPWLILGLGNPDDRYADTRHNAGVMVVERLADRFGERLRRSRQRAEVAEARDGETRIVLARPLGYMNESGGPASLLTRYYKVPLERLIVVHDDIDLAPGKADYVLAPIPKRLAEDFGVLVERGADAALDLTRMPLERAQDRHNH